MTKIVSLSYYADFSRFYSILSKKLNNVDWVDISIYPSSYLFNIFNGNRTHYLPYEVNRSFCSQNDMFISKDEYYWLTEYHVRDGSMDSLALKYVLFFYKYFKENKTDLIIVSGDSRLPARAMIYVAKIFKIETLHFEQGPYNTTILDPKGVNANCSFRNSSEISYNSKKLDYIKGNKSIRKWYGYRKYRIVDVFYQSIFRDRVLGKYKFPVFLKKKIIKDNVELNGNVILLVLQVPEDANMLLHSPYFKSHAEIVKSVHEAIPKGFSLVVREHPLYIGNYEQQMYDYIYSEKVSLDRNSNLYDLLNISKVVIVNNSTVGLEAMSLNKSLVVLGDAYYDNPKFVYKYEGVELDRIIENASVRKINDVSYRVNAIFSEGFIPGHFRDLEEERFDEIASYIDNVIKG